jgi:hypothetical protein
MMKRGILALAVAGALGSSVAYAETFLCRTAPDMSVTACSPVAFESRAFVAEPTAVIHTGPAASTARPIVERAVAVPEQSAVTITYEYPRSWPNTEPRVSTYRYSYGPSYYYYY